MKNRRFKLPHTLALIFIIMTIIASLTWIIPGGQYQRMTNEQGRELVVDGTFQYSENNPRGLFDLLKAPVAGLVQTADIIGFILILGGVFSIIQVTRTIDASIVRFSQRIAGREKIVIPVGMILFSIFGALFGMSEEVIPFVLIFVPMALALGYDSLVGVSIPFLGAGLGFAGAMFNPFTVGIAQGIAGLPLFSGLAYRIFVWLVVTTTGIILVMRYATIIRRHPEKSPVYTLDQARHEKHDRDEAENVSFDTRHKVILVLFMLAICLIIVGVSRYKWFIPEIAAIFLGLGIVVGLVAKLDVNTMAESFVNGARDLIGAALVVGFARAILVLASDGQIIDTVMFWLSKSIAPFHPVFAAQFMFVIQTFINFFVPSGSGQAALTLPIMAPLADLIGVTRQTAVLAFQMGDGFTNMIIPTSGVTMGVLGMAKIPWQTWARWLLPIELIFFLLSLLLLVPPVLLHWGPF